MAPTPPDADQPVPDHLVHEAVGPPLTGREAAAAIAVGINSLLVLGVLPVLLGALADEHRLGAPQLGVAAMIELLAMGVATGLAGAFLPARRLKLIGALASVAVAACDLATMGGRGEAIFLARAGAGVAEGILLWITVGMISRTQTPERWAGVFFTAQTLAQLGLAIVFAVGLIARFGAAGGYASLALVSLLGLIPAFALPSRFAPLPGDAVGGLPPARGWVALAATVIFVAAGGAVGVYMQPLAHQAGLGAGVARTALWTSLVGQVAGGAAATALAGRVRYFAVFIVAGAIYLATWAVMASDSPGWLFVAANALAGLGGLFLGPFLVPMMIDADPSRRAAVLSGAAQLLGGALGPLLAAAMVSDADVRGVAPLADGLLLAGLAGVAALRFTHRPAPGAAV